MRVDPDRGTIPSPAQTAVPGGLARVWPHFRVWVPLGLVVSLSVGGYLVASSRYYAPGFPLDDAWIHQTYARELARSGQWAFIPGQPSAGSTSPLWSLLLALGYLLRLPHLGWAYWLGGLSLLGLSLVGERLFREWVPGLRGWIPWAGLFLAGEWHLVWASVSGMETLLAGALVLLALLLTCRARRSRDWALIGLLVGLSVWVRPDGITLLGPPGLLLLAGARSWRERLRGLGWLAAGTALLVIPYLLFNLAVQGSIWPNTFYAKQAEYAVQLQAPIFARWFNELKLPLIGSGLFLLPGFVIFTWRAARGRDWAALSAVIWFLGYALLYALRLPVTYQYGRYFMPAMPVYFVTGLAGTVWLLDHLRASRIAWLLARVAAISAGVIWLAFYGIGAGRYAQDVAFIETEMVDAARWVATNTPEESLIAAHDIGAMGYFGERRILDLAGLVSPQVIPFIRDEARLAQWLDEQQADYLIILSDWYTLLPEGKTLAYRSEGRPSSSGELPDMLIYRWKP